MPIQNSSGRRSVAVAAAFTAALLAGCSGSTAGPSAGGSPTAPPGVPTSSAASPAASSSGTGALAVADSTLGEIIVDGRGMTVYSFTKDRAGSGTSACSGDCLVAWPAVPASSDTPSGTGITAKLGSITRDDGTRQVTVAGRPVYAFQKDLAPGDVTGQGVGGIWYAVSPDGTMITDEP